MNSGQEEIKQNEWVERLMAGEVERCEWHNPIPNLWQKAKGWPKPLEQNERKAQDNYLINSILKFKHKGAPLPQNINEMEKD